MHESGRQDSLSVFFFSGLVLVRSYTCHHQVSSVQPGALVHCQSLTNNPGTVVTYDGIVRIMDTFVRIMKRFALTVTAFVRIMTHLAF